MTSELVAMTFDKYFTVKLGLPENELPTFGYRILNEFGVFETQEAFGSIHANFPVDSYAPSVIEQHLCKWIGEQFEVDPSLIRAEIILGKPIYIENIMDFIKCYVDAVTVAHGVMLHEVRGEPMLHTVSRRHRMTEGGDIHKFANDICMLRKLFKQGVDIEVEARDVPGFKVVDGMRSYHDLQKKWPHMFAERTPVVDPYSLNGILARIRSWRNKHDVHVQAVVWRDAKFVAITLGNCEVTIDQRPKTVKVTVHTNSGVNSGPARHYSAQSPKSIDAALTDVLAVERISRQSGAGHYNTQRRVQYNVVTLRNWFEKIAKGNNLSIVEHYDAKKDVAVFMAVDKSIAGGLPIMCLKIFMLNAEIAINMDTDARWNRVGFYHDACEAPGKHNVEMYLADGLKRNRAICTV